MDLGLQGKVAIVTGGASNIGKAITDDEIREAAEYFAARTPLKGFTKVVESANVPKSYVGQGAMRFVTKDGGPEPIGNRIIELQWTKSFEVTSPYRCSV